jgi:hypothetical protein
MNTRPRSCRLACTLASAALGLGMSGGDCGGLLGPGGSTCPGTPVPSVILRITDAQGGILPTALIRFRVGSGPIYTGQCAGDCGAVRLASDTLGRFGIGVGSVGYLNGQAVVDVVADEGGCHPVTQNVTVKLDLDTSAGVLLGAWRFSSIIGDSILRFGEQGEIIGAILLDRTIAGDRNFYIAYNGRRIRGVTGQPIIQATADEPTRNGNVYHFRTTTQSYPVGFENAVMSTDFQTLTGMLAGVAD